MIEHQPVSVQFICASCSMLAGIGGYLWVAFTLMVFMFCATCLDLYFMWRRCARRKRLIAQRLNKGGQSA